MSVSELFIDSKVKASLDAGFTKKFGYKPERYFSAPGRTEIGGNHTDHQRGRVLAAAVNIDTRAAVSFNDSGIIRVQSKGYPLTTVKLTELEVQKRETNSTASIVRGIAARFVQLGRKITGFDAYCESDVASGSGLSSSAAFEVLIGTIINSELDADRFSMPEIAMIGQYAENVYFGKPCGLMDQTASAMGGLITIDFFHKDRTEIKVVDFDFSSCGHALCIIDSDTSHAGLTNEYAAITEELKQICAQFGKSVLTEISEDEFYEKLPELRKKCGDRAVLRAIHFYQENARVPKQVAALEKGNFDEFLRLVKESGHSSYMYLQNVIPSGRTRNQEMAVILALCEHLLKGRGAYRVHGGGFAGTVQAFVPLDMLEDFRKSIEKTLGKGTCHIFSIREHGGTEMKVKA